jgi:hypothetical protein
MKSLISMWICMLMVASTPVNAEPGKANPNGNAYGHQNENNPHYVAPVEEVANFTVCPFLQSAPHMCVNFNPTP